MKVVIDTNIFIPSFLSKSFPRTVFDFWKVGTIDICLSESIVTEYTRVLEKLGLKGEAEVDEILSLFARGYHTIFTSNTPTLKIVEEDPDDDKFFECAVALKAGHIISGDKAVLKVKNYFGIKVVSAREFVEVFSA